ncbi:hypothetical protein [Gloeothece verrucosa]|uniref:LSDAT prokaryote domain-containing protein n=1 Tax=Gloeothece verrucosa (strain PCC 7822) TaxID=497965 RepID=E0U618_GLOV7|nr:hypothetical protein [Gloeothece verrucosa]ADN17127.1 conserved hypothetical protein [Gloeothece verrucosa PCC 7822]
MKQLFEYNFNNGLNTKAVQVRDWQELPQALQLLGFTRSYSTLVLVGGAGKISESDYALVQKIFLRILAPLAESLQITVVDGGTDTGIMRLMGKARASIEGTFPLLGVAAYGTVVTPGLMTFNRDAACLDPYHTHFVLVPGHRWGDESQWLARIPSIISETSPSVTLVINGGEITWHDINFSVREGRPTLILAGSGGTADQIAAALREELCDAPTDTLISSGLIQAINIQHTHQLEQSLRDCFKH